MLNTTDGHLIRRPARVQIRTLAPSPFLPVVAFFALALLLVFSMSIGKGLDVDEHGFVASGVLLARHGLLPYRDYHYNHMPTEVLIYAVIFRVFGHLLLAAREFQVVCAAGAATTIFAVAFTAGKPFAHRRLLFAWAIGLLFLTNQLFTKTAALSWNHDFPLLAALLSFITLIKGLRAARSAPWVALSGVALWGVALSGFLAAVAATSRLTFLPIVAPAGLLVLTYPRITARRRLALGAVFCGGFALAALPSLWVWSKAWDQAFFGNFLYPHLNTAYHAAVEPHRQYTVIRILGYFLKSLLFFPTSGIATLAFLALLAVRLSQSKMQQRSAREALALGGIVLLLLAAGFMPAPPYIQYFYAPTPFMFLGIASWLPTLKPFHHNAEIWRIPIGLWIFCVCFGAPAYRHLALLPFPRRWVPLQIHREGVDIAAHLPPGPVLTIEPVFPLEGGMDIDPLFTVGRFAPRVADRLTAVQRARYLMPGFTEFDSLFKQSPPASLLVVRGSDAAVEHQFEAAAEAHNYRKVELPVRAGGPLYKFATAWIPRSPPDAPSRGK